MEYLKFWKWRKIYKARKALFELGKLVFLKKQKQNQLDNTASTDMRRMLKEQIKQINSAITKRLDSFKFN